MEKQETLAMEVLHSFAKKNKSMATAVIVLSTALIVSVIANIVMAVKK